MPYLDQIQISLAIGNTESPHKNIEQILKGL